MIDLSVVVVSWNVRDLLCECLESVQASSRADRTEVIVVDSASSDGTPEAVQERFPAVRLVKLDVNVGFSKGNNIGLEAAAGRYILLLNPDTRLVGKALECMVAYMDAHPTVGLIGPKLLNPDGTVQSSRRRFPTLWTGIFESTWLQCAAPQRVLSHFYMLDCSDDAICPVDWVYGAAMLVRREVVDQVGGFDEGFFMYSEELDWQKRIREAGWLIHYVPDAQIIHYGGKSSEQIVAQRHIYFQTSKIRYFRKHHGVLAGWFMRSFLLSNYVWQLGLEGLKGLLGHKRELRMNRVHAYWHVLRSGLRG